MSILNKISSENPLPRAWGLIIAMALLPVFMAINWLGYPDRAYLAVLFLIALLSAILVTPKLWKKKSYYITVIVLFCFYTLAVIFFNFHFPKTAPSLLYFSPIALVALFLNVFTLQLFSKT